MYIHTYINIHIYIHIYLRASPFPVCTTGRDCRGGPRAHFGGGHAPGAYQRGAPPKIFFVYLTCKKIVTYVWRAHKNMNIVFRLVNPSHGMDTYIFKVNGFTKQAKYE